MKVKGTPPTFAELAEHIGEDKARALCDRFGGSSFTIPREPVWTHPWVEILGVELFIELCFQCGGWGLRLPTCEYTRLQRRNQEMAQLKQQGKTIRELVELYKLTEARIYQILQEQSQPPSKL